MNMKRIVKRLTLVSMLVTILVVVLGATSAQPYFSGSSAYVDEHWFEIINNPYKYVRALREHEIDAGGIHRPEDYEMLKEEGFTIDSTKRLGYTFTVENNRMWPFGTPNGSPLDPYYENAMLFRKGLHRLIDKSRIVEELYDPLMSACEYYLPPGAAYWINPDCPAPVFDPGAWDDGGVYETGSAYLNYAGYVPGTEENDYEDADPDAPWYCPYLRIDPYTGDTMEPFEYYAIGLWKDPIGFEMAKLISKYFHTAGISCNLVAGTWNGMVTRLVNEDLYDYQLMTGVGIAWDSPAPDNLYDFTYSQNLPLWNLCAMNITELDEAGLRMMGTLDLAECRQAAFDIQTDLADYEPYLPLLLSEGFAAFTGPYNEHPGAIGIVNARDFGTIGICGEHFLLRGSGHATNTWGKMLGRARRYDPIRPGVKINKWGLGAYLDTLNPLTADSEPDWQILSLVEDTLFKRNPYNMDYMWWAATGMPTTEEWIGPGGSHIYGGYEGCDATYDNAYNGTHYACVGPNGNSETPQPDPYEECFDIVPQGDDYVLPIGPGPYMCDCGTSGPYDPPYVTEDCLAGDDVLGMVTSWTLRPGTYWHDSDPGDDGIFGTPDDGAVYPVTTADAEFGMNLLRYQLNARYMAQWQFVYGIKVEDEYSFKIFEERRFLFAFEGHDISLLTPKHMWEPFINPTIHIDYIELILPCGSVGYADAWDYYDEHPENYYNHHEDWRGWEEAYMVDPTDPEGRMLTYLIGFGPFKYHLGSWCPGSYAHVETNPCYFAGHICQSDVNFDQVADIFDSFPLLESMGSYGVWNYRIGADTCYPAQVVELSEPLKHIEHFGHYWGPDPVPPGLTRCPGIDDDC